MATVGLALAFVPGCAKLPGSGRVEGERWIQSYALQGTGPVVVFESGLGDGKHSWEAVFGPVSEFARAFAYDRAGYGASRSDAPSRDAFTVVSELRRTLRALSLTPPYVLVGHSLGGQYVELFARLHPEEVSGMVLVDARNTSYGARCEVEGLERCTLPWLARLMMPRAAQREVEASGRTEARIRATGSFPEVPLIVLTATRRPGSSEALKRVWAETQAELVELSPGARQEICEACGHYIQRDAPELVVDAVRSLVE
jgi:pimeloyl-ACP methyl ester carboxylesterase